MRTLFDVLEECTNVTQVAVLKFIVSTACIRSFYACLFETGIEMSQVWKSVETKARVMLMPRCQFPYDVAQTPAKLLNLIITSMLRVVPIEFLEAQACEIGVSVDGLVQLNQSLQGMEQDELLTYSETILQKYLELIPQEVKFEAIPIKVWLILGEKALLAVEYEKQQAPTDLAVNGDILEIQKWIREIK